jgi:hypothetical protein
MRDVPPKLLSRRRLILFGSFTAAACGTAAWFSSRRDSIPQRTGDAEVDNGTLLAFIAALFGRQLSPEDRVDLANRLGYMQQYRASLKRDCSVLEAYLDGQAAQWGVAGFAACDDWQKGRIVDRIMQITLQSKIASLLSRFSRTERDFYRMRWSTVPQLAWVYRHSPAAWRTRGYRRWPGVRGNRLDILAPGAPYP